MKKLFAALLIGAFAFAPASFAGDERKKQMSAMDTDRDGKISGDEMRAAYDSDRREFEAYDANKDGTIDSNEYADRELSFYDQNRDGYLDETEAAAYAGDDTRRRSFNRPGY